MLFLFLLPLHIEITTDLFSLFAKCMASLISLLSDFDTFSCNYLFFNDSCNLPNASSTSNF